MGETERSLADEVREFLAEYGLTKGALDRAIYPSFSHRFLTQGQGVAPRTIVKIRAWMEKVREEEPDLFREAARRIRLDGGFIAMSPGGKIEQAPPKVPHARVQRMIAQGWLVPTGDTLLAEVPSQTYKLSSLSQ